MAHMKGPWEWSGSDLNGINEKGDLDSVIFNTVEYDDGHYSELHCEKDDRALIAAAPDLLDALKGLLSQCRYLGFHPENPVIVRSAVAIKKATGEEL